MLMTSSCRDGEVKKKEGDEGAEIHDVLAVGQYSFRFR